MSQQDSKKPARATSKKGKTPKELMARHIKNEKDVISEEEFKELEIGINTNADTAHEALHITADSDRPKDEDKDHKVTTPWDVISD